MSVQRHTAVPFFRGQARLFEIASAQRPILCLTVRRLFFFFYMTLSFISLLHSSTLFYSCVFGLRDLLLFFWPKTCACTTSVFYRHTFLFALNSFLLMHTVTPTNPWSQSLSLLQQPQSNVLAIISISITGIATYKSSLLTCTAAAKLVCALTSSCFLSRSHRPRITSTSTNLTPWLLVQSVTCFRLRRERGIS